MQSPRQAKVQNTHAGRVIDDLMATVDLAIARVREQIQHQPINPSNK